MFAGVIFDFDGVLFDTHALHKQAWKQLLLELGRPISDDDLEFVRDGRKREDILCHFFGDLTTRELRVYGERKAELFRQLAGELGTMAGVPGFLAELQSAGVALAVATSASKSRAGESLQRSGLAARFRELITGDDVPRGKPDPAIFLLAAKRLDIRPKDALVIEDSIAGVRAAKSAGMSCLGIGCGALVARLVEQGATCVVPDFTGLSLAKINALFSVAASNDTSPASSAVGWPPVLQAAD